MGLVGQEPALFDTTIAGNILLGKEDADMEQVMAAAKAANVHSFIEELPDSYNTQVCVMYMRYIVCSICDQSSKFNALTVSWILGWRGRNSAFWRTKTKNCYC